MKKNEKKSIFYLSKRVLRAFGLSFLLLSCNNDSDVSDNLSDISIEQSSDNYKLSENEAKAILADFLEAMEAIPENDGIVSTRSASKRTIKDIAAVRADKSTIMTYASENNQYIDIDTLMYLINFDNNQGYAFVAADKRTTPIYAVIDEGYLSADSLHLADNPGFIMLIENAITKQLQDLSNYDEEVSPVNTYARPTGYTVAGYCGPFLKTKWGQDAPYNRYCPTGTVTGCGPTAIAQIISYYQTIGSVNWSDNYGAGGATLNWSNIISDCTSSSTYGRLFYNQYPTSSVQVAHLMRYLGVVLNVSYGTSTSTDVDDALSWLKKWSGLSNSSSFKSLSYDDVHSTLANGNLLFVKGFQSYYHVGFVFRKYTGGHGWIIDGFNEFVWSDNSRENYYHCNFGWDGTADGYYVAGVFDTTAGPSYIESGKETSQTSSSNFRYKIEGSHLKR